MDFALSAEQKMIRDLCRDFAEDEIQPLAEEIDRTRPVPLRDCPQDGGIGAAGAAIPRRVWRCGRGLPVLLPRPRRDRSWRRLSRHHDGGAHLARRDTVLSVRQEEQKQRYLVPLARGEHLWSFGLTEPGAGSDSAGTQTHAELRDGAWHINGAKNFITNAGTEMTGGVTITAVTGTLPTATWRSRTSSSPRARLATCIGKRLSQDGLARSDTRPLSFEDCQVPEENRIGERGEGFRHSR